MAAIKVENNLEYLEKEEGEIDDEFLEYSSPSEESSVKENGVEKVKVEQVTSPVSVEKVPEMELIVFTPPSHDEDLSSVSGQSDDDGDEEEETNEQIHGTSDELTCKIKDCHCIEVKKENQALRKVITELCRRNGEMDDFFQVEFGEKYNAFRNNRKYLIQMGFGKEYDSDRMAKGKTDKNTDVVQLLRMVKDENETRSAAPSEILFSEISPPTQSFAAEESELEISLQNRLTSMSNIEKRNRSDVKRKMRRDSPRLKETSTEISDLRELLNQSRRRRSSSQCQTECHSTHSKRARFSPSPPKIPSLFDFPETEGNGILESKFKLCSLCPLMVPSEELMDHLLIIHKGIQCLCPVCNLEFISRRTLRIHFFETHGDRSAEKFKTFNTIEPQIKEWLSEMVGLAIPISQEDFDSLEEIPGNLVNDEGWCIYVHNLGPDMDKRDLYDLFEPFGEIERVKVVRDPQTNNSKGFGFVSMRNYEEAVLAIQSRNGLTLSSSNKILHVSFAKTTKQRLLKCHT